MDWMLRTKPKLIEPGDEEKYVMAICKCPLDLRYAIKMPKEPDKIAYSFECSECGTCGTVFTNDNTYIMKSPRKKSQSVKGRKHTKGGD